MLASLVLAAGVLLGRGEDPGAAAPPTEFRAVAWNIFRGGREDGAEVGPQRVAEVLRATDADLIALQETYGSGEILAKALGYHFLPRGTNVSILSRFPIVEDVSVFEEFKCVGAIVELPGGRRVAFYSVWLPFSGEIWLPGTRDPSDVAEMLAACAASVPDAQAILAAIDARLSRPQYAGIPIVIGGDFNSMSHLDYAAVARDQYHAVVEWPTSRVMVDAGYRDAYRETNPVIDRSRDRTWTPRFPEQEEDRIDFLYYRGDGLRALESRMIDTHDPKFPSDHSAVVARFRLEPARAPGPLRSRVATYNIRHGRGMDGRVDLARTAEAVRRLRADVVGLQEVDMNVRRSGGENQMRALGRRLGMHAAFGAFMDYDGGQYGMGVLSRYPIRRVEDVRLPEGNEPRIALAVLVAPFDGPAFWVVNVHFDWVDDDGFRFAQASALAEWLRVRTEPFVLLGDFNDGPDSRTLALFRPLAREAAKPAADRLTWSSVRPEQEIDFIFAGPPDRWTADAASVIDDPVTSDHRAVVARLELR